MLPLLLLKINLFLSFTAFATDTCPLKEGDLVFIKSQTNQAKLLAMATGSEWSHVGIIFNKNGKLTVAEAVQPVRWTSVSDFIKRSKAYDFEIKRVNFQYNLENVKKYVESKMSLDYDLIFSWDDKRFYCTELIWKAFHLDTGKELGSLEKIGELKNIDHPLIATEAKKRFEQYKEDYDHEVWKSYPIITPIQMFNSESLKEVMNKSQAPLLIECNI